METTLPSEFKGYCVVALACSGKVVKECAYDRVIYNGSASGRNVIIDEIGRRYCLSDRPSLAAFRVSPTMYITKAAANAEEATDDSIAPADQHPHFGTGKPIEIEETVK